MDQNSWRFKVGLFAAKSVAIIAVLLTGVFLHRLSHFSAHCYSSQIVDRLVLFSEQIEVPNCRRAVTDLVLSGRSLADTDRQWNRWTAPLDRVVSLWGRRPRGLIVVETREEPFALYRDGDHLILGSEWSRNWRIWAETVMAAWIARVFESPSKLEESVLSEFMVSMVEGRHRLIGLNQNPLEDGEINWANAATSDEAYCQSPLRRPEELDECHTEHGEALRPLLSRGLWLVYRRADWKERRDLLNWLTGPVARGRESLLAAKPERDDPLPWLKSEIERWAEKAGLKEQELQLSGIQISLGLKHAESPHVLVSAKRPADLKLFGEEVLPFLDHEDLSWASTRVISTPPPTELWPKNVVKIVCKKPPLERISEMAENTVLVVLACQSSGLQGWSYLARHDLKAFIAANPMVPMIWLNAAGVRQTLDRERLTHVPLSLKRLRSLSQWREDRWDKATNAFVPRAALDLVLSHRASRDLL